MKNPEYNGVCLSLIGKDGNRKNVPATIVFVHNETKDNFAWFFASCIAAGIRLHDRVVFTDRGLQLKAQQLLSSFGLELNIKFCSLHIAFNTVHRFKPGYPDIEQRVAPFIYRLQATELRKEYEQVMGEIRQSFPIPDQPGSRGQSTVADYLVSIHPTNWTRFGNCTLSNAEVEYLQIQWKKKKSHGRPIPLFGVRTTSGTEGKNNAIIWCMIQDQLPYGALVSFCNRVMNVVSK